MIELDKQMTLMKEHLKVLVDLLTKNDLKALLQHYLASNESENVVQLAFMFQQAQTQLTHFEFYQELVTKLIGSKTFPIAVISKISSNDTLSFFTPALQLEENFTTRDDRQRNVLHYLFVGKQLTEKDQSPPFNYIRSMMLFETNETLRTALCQRDNNNFTPLEAYLTINKNFTPLPAHELIALFALIEIESKQQAVVEGNYQVVVQAVNKLFHNQKQIINSELQRLILIAAYYERTIEHVVNDVL